MTREEAITRLKNMAWLYGSVEREQNIEAIDMAIEALSEPKTGEWVDDCTCSICHWMHEDNNGFALITKYNYCPNCGAYMNETRAYG